MFFLLLFKRYFCLRGGDGLAKHASKDHNPFDKCVSGVEQIAWGGSLQRLKWIFACLACAHSLIENKKAKLKAEVWRFFSWYPNLSSSSLLETYTVYSCKSLPR